MTKIYRAIKTEQDKQPCFENYDRENPDDSERSSAITGTFRSIWFNNKEVNRRRDNEPMVLREVYINLVNKAGEEVVIKGVISFHYPQQDKTTINYTVMGMVNKLANYKELGKLEFTIVKKKSTYISIVERKSWGQDDILYDKYSYDEQQTMPDLLEKIEQNALLIQVINTDEKAEEESDVLAESKTLEALEDKKRADDVGKDARFWEPDTDSLPF